MPQLNQRRATNIPASLSQLLIAFAAGFLSLALQSTLLRIGIQEIGGNQATTAAILATALLGLAMGATCFGKLADSGKHQNKLPSILLGLVSVAAILYALGARPFASYISTLFAGDGGELGWSPLAFAVLTSLPVHALIGGIIPGLIAWKSAQSNQSEIGVRRAVAVLYAFETGGAAVGAILTTFTLIPIIGIFAALISCGVVGIAVAMFGIVFLGRVSPAPILTTPTDLPLSSNPSEAEDTATANKPRPRSTVLLMAILMSSFASLGLELIWQRFFVFLLGSDSRSYAVVVAVTLIGISIGSWLSGLKWLRTWNLLTYSVSLIAISASTALSLILLWYGMRVEMMQASLDWLLLSPFYARLLLIMLVLLLPSICIGFSFPLASELFVQERNHVGVGIGWLYAVVAFGNVLGIFICSSILIPILGLHQSAITLAALPLVAGLLMAALYPRREGSTRARVIFTTTVMGILCGCSLLAATLSNAARSRTVQQEKWSEIFYFEDSVHTVAVNQSRSQQGRKRLLIDGVTVGESFSGVDEKQRLLAHLPFLLKGKCESQDVYTVGLGTGILASDLAAHDCVNKVIATELSKGVIQAVDCFADSNGNLSQQKKVHIINDDGIRFLRKSTSNYDVIVSDGKSRPGSASNVAFLSRDYYQLCVKKLTDNGLFLQWVSSNCDGKELSSILKAFAGVFPHGHVGFSSPGSIYLVGSNCELNLDSEEIDRRLQKEQAASLRQYGWASADDILSMYWMDQSILNLALDQQIQTNTFDKPVLELFAWDSFRYSVQQLPPQLSMLESLIAKDTESIFNGVSNNSEAGATNTALANARKATTEILAADRLRLAASSDWLDKAAGHWKRAMAFSPKLNRQQSIARQYQALANQASKSNDTATEFSAIVNMVELKSESANNRLRLAEILQQHGAYEEALPHHYAAVKQAKNKAPYRIPFAQCLMMLQKYGQAHRQLATAINESSSDSPNKMAKVLLEICLFKTGNSDGESLRDIIQRASGDPELSALLRKFQIPLNDSGSNGN